MKRLSDEDRRAWDAYRKTTDPLEEARNKLERRSVIEPAPVAGATDGPAPIARFRIGEGARSSTSAHSLAPSLTDTVRGATVQMDRKAWNRLQAGKLRPEAKLDLHGMTLQTAHPALMDFILGHHARGRRLLLVVTGKGKRKDDGSPIPTRLGVLRHQVPQWLRMPPLAPLVLQVAQAHQSHGGLGAYYVYLRRSR